MPGAPSSRCSILSLLAICSEAFLAFALWMPRWRPAAMVVGLGLHVFIAGWLSPTSSLFVFSLLMLPLYLLFLDAVPEGRVVVWDDGCGFCATWVAWFRRLDWMHALRFVPRSQLAVGQSAGQRGCRRPRAADRAAQRRVRGGFAAVTRVAEILPVSYLWAPCCACSRSPPSARRPTGASLSGAGASCRLRASPASEPRSS